MHLVAVVAAIPILVAEALLLASLALPASQPGADGEIRTHDLPLTRRLLCQLSYVGKLVCEARGGRMASRAVG
jgi:hypothetical protein